MIDRVGDLWGSWLAGGLPLAVLVVVLSLSGVVWLTASVVAARTAARHYRSAFGWGFFVATVPVLGMAVAVFWPGLFPWFAAGAAVLAALLALMARWLIRRALWIGRP
jgi:hypothetical protein